MENMKHLILFDVDGTLTPSRGTIDGKFKHWLETELKYEFHLITGSDPEKTQEQVGMDFWSNHMVYNCAANHIFDHGQEIYRSAWRAPEDLETMLNHRLSISEYPTKTGRHIEHRVGLCNFSVVGRNATPAQRQEYYQWDQQEREREKLALMINEVWKDIEATVAGETGIDIYKKGTGKDQILSRLGEYDTVNFLGDRMDPSGNDFLLAKAILTNNRGNCYYVKNWEDCWRILKEINAK
jgi:phosphomannomutase